MSEALFNRLINSDSGLISSTKTEYFDPRTDFGSQSKVGKIFLLKTYRPTVITSINGVSPGTANVDYTLVGRRLEFQYGKDYSSVFPFRYTVVYTSGLTTEEIGNDIKTVCYYLSKGLFERKRHMDVASFRQDLLSVNFTTSNDFLDVVSNPSEISFIKLITNKYLIPHFYAV